MSIRRHLSSEQGPVPITPAMDPHLQSIVRAGNAGVSDSTSAKRKRTVKGKRFCWAEEDRFRIGKMAHELKSNKAALKEARLIFPSANESTVRNFKRAYLVAIRANPALEAVERASLKKKKRGKPVKFGKYDAQIITYLRAIRKHGGKVNRPVVQGAAFGILREKAPHLLQPGENVITRAWCNSILRRIKFVKRKGTKAAKKVPEDAAEQHQRYLNRIHYIMKKYNIPPSMFVTFDETSSSLVPADDWTLEERGSTQVPIAGLEDKRNVTLGLSFSGSKVLLDSQIIYEGKTNQCHAQFNFPPHLKPTHSESHWSTEDTNVEYIDDCLDPYMNEQRQALNLRPTQYGLLSWDVFKSHTTRRVLDLLEARYIKVVFVPPNCTSISSANDHPEFNKNVKGLNKNAFMHFYAGKVADSLASGENEVFVQFPMAEMKPLHAKWTAESLQFVATQEQWMENALRGVGVWDVLYGNFTPDPSMEAEYFPPVATAEEALADRGDTESEYEFVSDSEQEPEEGEDDYEEHDEDFFENEQECNDDYYEERDCEEPHTPVYNSPPPNNASDSEGETVHQSLKRRRTVLADTDDEDSPPPNAKQDFPLRPTIPETPLSKGTTPLRRTRTANNARMIEAEQAEIQEAIARSLLCLSQGSPKTTGETLDMNDGECVDEEETERFAKKFMQEGQWRVMYLNEAWQLAKRCLFQLSDIPKRTPKHPTLHTYIVSMNVAPKKIQRIEGDGSCLFRAISFGIFRNEEAHRAVRSEILKYMAEIWNTQPKVRLFAAMWFQQKTKQQLNVAPSKVVLTCQQYIEAVRMDAPTTWGGSTELEVAAQWLRSIIKVYYYGNPKYPPKSWISYGTTTAPYDAHTLLLVWTNGDHYDYVTELY